MLLLGSGVEVVKAALTAAEEGNGLASTAEFEEAFAGLSVTNNAFQFISKRAGETIKEIQNSAMKSGGGADADQIAAFAEQLQSSGFLGNDKLHGASVTRNWKSGIVTSGRSAQGGREVVMSYTVMPIALAAAIAIPSFQKARTTAQGNACINNLRQVDAAKEMWAMENNKVDGDEADIDGISKYIMGNALPMCPQGGEITVNVIGTSPECSLPQHQLP